MLFRSSDSDEEHIRNLRQVFKILKDNHLYLNPDKSEFDTDEVKFLGHIVGHRQIRADPKKIEAIDKWPRPTNVKQLQSILRMGNWLQCFVKGYSKIVRLLTQLTRKADWMWMDEQENAFLELKECLMHPPILTIANATDLFRVEADSSDFTTSGVLMQKQEGQWKIIAYRSEALSEAE